MVYKRRITASPADAAAFLRTGKSTQPLGQICREIAWFQHTYHAEPKVLLAYDRTAFSGAHPAVRITFDTDIRWRTTALDLRRGDHGAPLLPPEQIPNGAQAPRRVPAVAQPRTDGY
ncbi:MAG: VTC domain-containing protein [Oscillospiraceae bacterium]